MGCFIIFRNKLNGFWVFYYGTNLSAGFTQLSDDHNLLVLSKGFTRFSNPKATGFMMLSGGLKKQKEEEEEKKTFP
jgi:hypothetical protein